MGRKKIKVEEFGLSKSRSSPLTCVERRYVVEIKKNKLLNSFFFECTMYNRHHRHRSECRCEQEHKKLSGSCEKIILCRSRRMDDTGIKYKKTKSRTPESDTRHSVEPSDWRQCRMNENSSVTSAVFKLLSMALQRHRRRSPHSLTFSFYIRSAVKAMKT